MRKLWKQRVLFRRAYIWMLAVLIVLELGMHVNGLWYFDLSAKETETNKMVEVAAGRSPAPRIAALGSSLSQFSIVPGVLETQLDLEAGAIANLGYPVASPLDYLSMYKTHREYFSGAEVLLVEASSYHYNWNVIAGNGNMVRRFREQSGFSGRASVPGIENKIDFIVGYISKFWDSRDVIKSDLVTVIRGKPQGDVTDDWFEVYSNGQIGTDLYSERSPIELSDIDNQVHGIDFQDFTFLDFQLRALTELVDIAHTDGVSVVLIEPKKSPYYDGAVADYYLAEDRRWRARIQESTGLQVFTFELADTRCANWLNCYHDYGHLNSIGAITYSEALARFLLTERTDK